jgi:hypothetical protein
MARDGEGEIAEGEAVTVALKIVSSSQLPEPPYPGDTRVRGWRFELDYERLNQSDTWAIAPPDTRPWLLMLWLTAWQQAPAGSMPADDQIIAAKIGMELRQFVAHKDILLRGWQAYSDGRLYHPVIVEQVLSYQEFNRKERERVAAWRDKKRQEDDGVTRNIRVSYVGVRTPEPEPEPLNKSTLRVDVRIPTDSDPPPAKNCPIAKIVALYHERLPELPKVEKITQTRAGLIRQRWREDLPTIEHWENFFAFVRESKFLMGKAAPSGTRPPFVADLEWLVRPSNFAKIAEEKYHRG